jgi:hypothetical protein
MLLTGSIVLSLSLSAVCTPLSRRTADVITKCVVNNTVALTFVCADVLYAENVLKYGKTQTGRWSV